MLITHIFKNIFSYLWIFSSITLIFLSIIFKSPGPKYDGGLYYIGFNLLWITCLYIFRKEISKHKIKISRNIYILGVIPMLFVTPLFENDHYRYIWEGKVIASGHNPYIHSPNSELLKNITYERKESIGFKDLTTVYPPLGLINFWFVSHFDFPTALKLLMIFNSLLVILWFKLLFNFSIKPVYLLLFIPYLQKEFIMAIHIDLLASLFLLFGVIKVVTNHSIVPKIFVFSSLSYWTKILGIITLPFHFFYSNDNNKPIKEYIYFIISILSLPLFSYILLDDIEQLKGVLSFSKTWVWNPGFYAILENISGLDESTRRFLCFIGYVLSYIIIFLWYLLKITHHNKKVFFVLTHLLLYSSLMFFSPVFNAWYAIWFLPYALLLNNRWGVLYAFLSCFSYLAYGHIEYRYYGHFINHIFFIIMVIEVIFKKKYLSRLQLKTRLHQSIY